jgi:predicted membrane GTPase involved in stress response
MTHIGVLISNVQVEELDVAFYKLQERGCLLAKPGDVVYEGQIVGIRRWENDLVTISHKDKLLANICIAGKDDAIKLTLPLRYSLEQALEFVAEDEQWEVRSGAMRLLESPWSLSGRREKARRQSVQSGLWSSAWLAKLLFRDALLCVRSSWGTSLMTTEIRYTISRENNVRIFN